MKISIITVCFNSASTIGQTISSVSSQTHPDIEHIVIDGLSTDGTMSIVQSSPSIAKFVSEADAGIYDAMNKGIQLCTGDVVGILNADDFYEDEQVLSKVAEIFQDPLIDACYGDLLYVDQNDTSQIVRYWKSAPYKSGKFKMGWMPAHPTFFVRRGVYDSFGGFDLSYKLAADFELLFRLIEKHQIKTKYLPQILVKMRMGGATNKSLKNIITQNKEILNALNKHYGSNQFFKFVAGKLVSRLTQFLARPTK